MTDRDMDNNIIPMYRKNSEIDQIIRENTSKILEKYPECEKIYFKEIADDENASVKQKTIQQEFKGCEYIPKMSVYDFIVRFVLAPKEARKHYKRYLMGEPNATGCVFTLKDLIYDISANPIIIDGREVRGDVNTVKEYFYGKKPGKRGEHKETTGLINRLQKWNFDVQRYPDNEFKCKLLYMLYDYEKSEGVRLENYFLTPTLENVDNAKREKPTKNGALTHYFKAEILKEINEFGLRLILNIYLKFMQVPLKYCINTCYDITKVHNTCSEKKKRRQLLELQKSLETIYEHMPDVTADSRIADENYKRILFDFYIRLELHELEGRERDIVDVYNDIYISGVDHQQVAYISETVGLPVTIPWVQVKEGLTQLGYDWSNIENLWALTNDDNVRSISFILGSNVLYQEELEQFAQRMVKCENPDDAFTEMIKYIEDLGQINFETIKIRDIEEYVKKHGNELFQEVVCAHNLDSGIKRELKRKLKNLSQYVTTYVTAKRFVNANRRKDIFKHELVQDLREMLFLTASSIDNPFYRHNTAERRATLKAQLRKDTIYTPYFFEKNAYAFVEISRIRSAEMEQNLEMFKAARACENEIDKILLKLYSYGDLFLSETIAMQVSFLVEATCDARHVALLGKLNISGKITSDENYMYFVGADNQGWTFGWPTKLDMYLIYGIIGWGHKREHPYMVLSRNEFQKVLTELVEGLLVEEKTFYIALSARPKVIVTISINAKKKRILITDYKIEILGMED